ncbi:hypothetical protein ACHAXT_010467 [Thalassiosira profunda]
MSTARRQRQCIDRRSAISAAAVSWALASDSASASLLDAPSLLSTDADSDASGAPDSPIIAHPNPRAITTITIASPQQSAGLELYETKIGTPRRTVVAVHCVRPNGVGANAGMKRAKSTSSLLSAAQLNKKAKV